MNPSTLQANVTDVHSKDKSLSVPYKKCTGVYVCVPTFMHATRTWMKLNNRKMKSTKDGDGGCVISVLNVKQE